jgi:large conductance mechanosensitive channel
MAAKTLQEFQKFIMRGNVIDMAVGVIIGGAFGKIVTSLVNDVIMPPIGRVVGKVNFTDLFVSLNGQVYPSLAEAQKAGAPTLNYGLFINNIINFLIVAFCIFIVIKQISALQARFEKPAGPAPVTTKECPFCFSVIPVRATRCAHCTSDVSAAKV